MSVKVTIDEDLCIACGVCYGVCPEVYESDESGISQLVEKYRTDNNRIGEVPAELLECAHQGEEDCPVDAIEVTGD